MQSVSYHREGDYLLPDLLPPTAPEKPVGVWGQRFLRHLKTHRKCEYTTMLLCGTLYQNAAEINDQAEAMLAQLISDMAEQRHITEQLKAQDQLRWVGEMNNIRAAAEEIVLREVVLR